MPLSAREHLDREFLNIRAALLDIAAALDRLDRGADREGIAHDPRLADLLQAVRLLGDGQPDRAKRIQALFSDPYDPAWR